MDAKQKKYVFLVLKIACLAFFLPMPALATRAAIVISQVLYDPLPDFGDEAVEFRNTGEEAVNIGSWYLSTTASERDASIPNNTLLLPGQNYLIAGVDWNGSLERQPNHKEAITLRNEHGGVALRDAQGQVKDAVGWGDPAKIPAGLFLGTPAPLTKKGQALLRIAFTNNNANDFLPASPEFTPPDGVSLEVEVLHSNVSAQAFILEDDHLDQPGIQLKPFPGKPRVIRIAADAPGAVRFQNQSVLLRSNSTNSTTPSNTTYLAELSLPSALPPGLKTIDLLWEPLAPLDTAGTSVSSLPFEWLPLQAWSFSATRLQFNVTPGQSALVSTRLQNLGNVPVELSIISRELQNVKHAIPAQQLQLKLGNRATSFAPLTTLAPFTLNSGEALDVWLKLDVPARTPQGTYRGSVRAIASVKNEN